MATTPKNSSIYQKPPPGFKRAELLIKLMKEPESLPLKDAAKRLGIQLQQAKLIKKQMHRARNPKLFYLNASKQEQKAQLAQNQRKATGTGGQVDPLSHEKVIGTAIEEEYFEPRKPSKLQENQCRAQPCESTYYCSTSTIVKSEASKAPAESRSPKRVIEVGQRKKIINHHTLLDRQSTGIVKEPRKQCQRALRIPAKYPELSQYYISLDTLYMLTRACPSKEFLTLAINRYLLKRELALVTKQIGESRLSENERKGLETKKKNLIVHLGTVAEDMISKLI